MTASNDNQQPMTATAQPATAVNGGISFQPSNDGWRPTGCCRIAATSRKLHQPTVAPSANHPAAILLLTAYPDDQ
jgi:hypothetical protein